MQNRPLDVVHPVLFVDAIHVKVRDGQVSNRPFYVVVGVTVDGHRDILGIWAGAGGGAGEGAKYWLPVLTEIKIRGVADACIVVCDGLKGLPESITTVWPQALVQACVLHLIRNTFRYPSGKYWEQMARDLRPVYTAPTEAAAAARFDRQGTSAVGDALEARAQRLRDHLRRPYRPCQLTNLTGYTVDRTLPKAHRARSWAAGVGRSAGREPGQGPGGLVLMSCSVRRLSNGRMPRAR